MKAVMKGAAGTITAVTLAASLMAMHKTAIQVGLDEAQAAAVVNMAMLLMLAAVILTVATMELMHQLGRGRKSDS